MKSYSCWHFHSPTRPYTTPISCDNGACECDCHFGKRLIPLVSFDEPLRQKHSNDSTVVERFSRYKKELK